MIRGLQMPGSVLAEPMHGVVWYLMKKGALFIRVQVPLHLIFMAVTVQAQIYLQIVFWRWMQVPVKEYGIFKRFTMMYGTAIFLVHPTWHQ
jgi:hypothetical protein